MCGIAGFCDPKGNFFEEEGKWNHILDKMNRIQKRRGPDDQGTYLDRGCGLAHVRLEIIDLVTGHQPMIHTQKLPGLMPLSTTVKYTTCLS